MNRCQRSVVLAGRMASLTRPRALALGRRRRGAGQRQHLLAPHLQRIEQLLEAELRVLGVRRHDRLPALLVERLVEPRQHQRAVGQAGHDPQQLRHGGHAAHHAGDDHRRVGRRLAPLLRLRQHQVPCRAASWRRRRARRGGPASARSRCAGTPASSPSARQTSRARGRASGRSRRPRSPSRPSGGPARAPAWPTAPACGRPSACMRQCRPRARCRRARPRTNAAPAWREPAGGRSRRWPARPRPRRLQIRARW